MKQYFFIVAVILSLQASSQQWVKHENSIYLKWNNDSILMDGNAQFLSAFWGNVKGNINLQTDLVAALTAKQNNLVSGTSIKTINGTSLLGSGDITISGGGGISWGGITGTLSAQTDLQSALNGKENIITAGTTAQYYRGDKSFQALDKAAVGLPNIDNTSDANKPISIANQAALDAKQNNLVSGTTIKTVNGTSLLGSGNITISGAPVFVNLASAFSSVVTTPAPVSGWSIAVTAGTTYRITVIADYQTAATTTGGIIGISLTGATGSVRGYATGTIAQAAAASELTAPIRATSSAGSTLTTTGVAVINSPHYIGMDITFTCTGSGTFNIVWASEVAASAAQLNANSSLIYQALN